MDMQILKSLPWRAAVHKIFEMLWEVELAWLNDPRWVSSSLSLEYVVMDNPQNSQKLNLNTGAQGLRSGEYTPRRSGSGEQEEIGRIRPDDMPRFRPDRLPEYGNRYRCHRVTGLVNDLRVQSRSDVSCNKCIRTLRVFSLTFQTN